MKDFEQLHHTADVKIRVYAKDMPNLFKNALRGMFHLLRPEMKNCFYQNDRIICKTLDIHREFGVSSPDINALLVDFLSYALYLSDVHHEIYLDSNFSILTSQEASGILRGVSIQKINASEIKAVTYHDLHIQNKDGIWQTDIVFDI